MVLHCILSIVGVMQKEEVQILIRKYLDETATSGELEQLRVWYASGSEENAEWLAEVENEEELLKLAMYKNIERELGFRSIVIPGRVRLWPRITLAAAAVAAIVFGVWFFNASRHSDTPRHPELVSEPQDIAPGKNGATITLANGKVIQLSNAKSGVVIGNDKLVYNDNLPVISSEARDLLNSTDKRSLLAALVRDDDLTLYINFFISIQ